MQGIAKMMNLKFLPLFLTVIPFMASPTTSTTPRDNYFVACGSSRNFSYMGRTFLPDSHHTSVRFDSEYSFTAVSSNSSSPSLYQSARVFTSSASYTFEIYQKGWHFIRLYFHPLSQRLASVSFSVVTETYVLLDSFSFNSSSPLYLSKEYGINVNASTLTLTFIPSRNSDVVFVNAIEVVSVPNEVVSFNYNVALETMYRLDMGGSSSVTSQNDNLFRIWEEDDKYLQDNLLALNLSVDPFSLKSSLTNVAPKHVYSTAKALKNISTRSNLTWVFPVNPNFKYIMRMHFCDIISKSKNSLFFNVYINSGVAVKNLNLSALTYDVGVPYFFDFVVNSTIGGSNLSVSVEPDDGLELSLNAIMNGLEIMKMMSNDVGSLDRLSSDHDIFQKSTSKIPTLMTLLVYALGGSVLLALIAAFYYYYHYGVFMANRNEFDENNSNGLAGVSPLVTLHGRHCRRFTLQEVRAATNNFQEQHLLGSGGFGKVYMGRLENGTRVAVKRASPKSKQGLSEFQNEINLLSKLRHNHLVSLIGFCHEETEMILVYEYMANGPLSRHLYSHNDDLVPLSWKQRLEICIGAARGLHYLHTGASQSIIHRDVKASNILLNDNFVAKVSDFGISRKGPLLNMSHVSTHVKGSFGYFDPEYFRSRHLTEKSDVYSFGVVLLEVLCGRPALDNALPTQERNLAGWALQNCVDKGMLDEKIIDPSLKGKAKVESVKKVWEVAKMCLEHHRINRPTMGYVMCRLEDALHLYLMISD